MPVCAGNDIAMAPLATWWTWQANRSRTSTRRLSASTA